MLAASSTHGSTGSPSPFDHPREVVEEADSEGQFDDLRIAVVATQLSKFVIGHPVDVLGLQFGPSQRQAIRRRQLIQLAGAQPREKRFAVAPGIPKEPHEVRGAVRAAVHLRDPHGHRELDCRRHRAVIGERLHEVGERLDRTRLVRERPQVVRYAAGSCWLEAIDIPKQVGGRRCQRHTGHRVGPSPSQRFKLRH